MPKTFTETSGNGVTAPLLNVAVELPDSGQTIKIAGNIGLVGAALQVLSPSTLTAPTAPGSGLIYFIIQAATATGVCTIKQSTSALPTPDAGNILIYSNILATTDTSEANDVNSVEPDQW